MAWKKRFNLPTYCFILNGSARNFLLLLFVIFIQLSSFAQDSLWTKEQWEETRKDYIYKDPEKKEEEEKEIDEQTELDFNDDSNWQLELSDTARMAILVSFVIILAALLIYFFWGKGSSDQRLKEIELNMLVLEHNLDKIDPDQFLNKVLDTNDYKTAVRLHFLSTLRRLHLIQWINWKKDKTNYDFLREMRTREQYPAFKELTLAFEVVWYGDTDINEAQYLLIKEKFDSLIQTLPNEK